MPTYDPETLVRYAKHLEEENERLRAALVIARKWMPIHPLPNTGAVEDCKIVDEALTAAKHTGG